MARIMSRFVNYLDEEVKEDIVKSMVGSKKKEPTAKTPVTKKKDSKKKERLKPEIHKDQFGVDKAHYDMVQKLTSGGWKHIGHNVYVNGSRKGKLDGSIFKELDNKGMSGDKNSQIQNPIQKQETLSPKEKKEKQDSEASKTGTAPSYLKTDKEIAQWYFENGGKDRRLRMTQNAQDELDKLIQQDNEKKESEAATKVSSLKSTIVDKKYPTHIGDKDKTLKEIETSKQKAFTEGLYDYDKGDDDFYKKLNDYNGNDISISNKWEPLIFLSSSNKIPQRELQILIRMMNTRPISSTEPPISFFTNGGAGGAGKLQAQAGELMTMIATSLSKKEMNEFSKSLISHLGQFEKNEKTIITKDWIKAATNNASAIHNRIQKEFNVDDASSIITHTCWDTKDDVEALGLNDYKKNKGFSSDVYIKLKLPNGQVILNEVSLKKDKNINFLNSSTGKFKIWDKNLPPEIDPIVYASNLKRSLSNSIDKDEINRLLSSASTPEINELKALLAKNKEININKFITGDNRESRKILLASLKVQASMDDKKAQEALSDIKRMNKMYAIDSIKAIASNEKLKKGMLDEIKSEFPLKSVTENEETMAIGDMSVDKNIINDIFKTDKWDEIQENLEAVTDKEPPILAYKVKGSNEYIPIAIINVREDGVGYGASFKFEMTLDPRFATILKSSNNKLYSMKKIDESSSLYKWMLYYQIEEDD